MNDRGNQKNQKEEYKKGAKFYLPLFYLLIANLNDQEF